MKTFQTYSEVIASVGQEVAVTDWITITQEQVNQFAQATGDHQWIHVDPERARSGPFGAPIAHGFLTLSLIPRFFESAFAIEGARMGVNYGLNRVRFTAPVPVGSRLRARPIQLGCSTWAFWLRHGGFSSRVRGDYPRRSTMIRDPAGSRDQPSGRRERTPGHFALPRR